jgi:hypothetical protein
LVDGNVCRQFPVFWLKRREVPGHVGIADLPRSRFSVRANVISHQIQGGCDRVVVPIGVKNVWVLTTTVIVESFEDEVQIVATFGREAGPRIVRIGRLTFLIEVLRAHV